MVRITIFSRRNRNTMAFTARLFMVLAIAVPILARSDELPKEFPPGHEQGDHIRAILQRVRDSCPPFGHPDNKFNVTVLGTISPKVGGCAYMARPHHDILPSFNLWMGSPKTGGGNCGEKNMDHYMFDCIAKHPYFTEQDTLEGWYITLYDRGPRWTGRQNFRCALYKTIKEDPPMIQMVISGNQSCKDLSKKMEQSDHTVSEGSRHFADGSVALLFSRDLPPMPVLRKKRSEEQGRGCRFPDWSQGSWTDLKVDENLIRYEPAFHDKDDVDYGQENYDGKDGDPENTDGEHYMQRSQRYAPVGISGIDHSSSHDSRSYRGRRSIPYINTIKKYRTSTVKNNPLDGDSIKHQSSVFSDQSKPLSNTNIQFPGSVKSSSMFDYKDTTTTGPQDYRKDLNDSSFGWNIIFDQLRQLKNLGNQYDDYKDTTTTGPQDYPKDLNENSFGWNIILDQLRQIKDLGNQHDDSKKETNNEKNRCFCYTDFKAFTPKNYKEKMELFNKVNKYSSTQKYPENLKEKSNYPFDVFELRKKRELGDQDVKEDTKHRQKINYSDRDFEPYTPGDMDIPIILDEKYTFSTKKKTTNLNNKLYPFDYVQRKKRNVKHLLNYGEEEIDNKKKKCYCYSDSEGFLPKNATFIKKEIDKLIKYLPGTKKYPEEVKEKLNNPLNMFEHRKKRELYDQKDYARKKKCLLGVLGLHTTTTERIRDLNFEYPYDGPPRDPHDPPEEYFGTTQDPRTYHYRKSRSIVVDKVKEDDEEEALKKIKNTDDPNKRWGNIMWAIEQIRNSSKGHLNGDIEYNEDIPASVRYIKNAEAHGVPYKQALLNWRTTEREYRRRIAEILYTDFSSKVHPDIIMRDFDRTFDGIEYDFDPMHPEGTADDPTAYRALTLPGGNQLEPRLSRRTTFEQKQSSDSPELATKFGPIHVIDIDDRTDQGNTQSLNQWRRRRSTQQNQQQHETTTFTWRCEMAVDNDVKQLPQFENGAKFLTYGGRVVDNNEMTGNDEQNEQGSKMTYGCLWLVPRGPNILEFSIIGTGTPSKNQSMQTFARQLCNENHAHGKDTGTPNEKSLRLRRPSWVTETRTDDKKRVPVRCPVPPGIVFYGVVPAPPPPSTVSTNKDQITPLRLCAKLVSSADDCTAGQMGPADQMKYTVSECVEQDSLTGTSQTEVEQQTIFEAASRGYNVGGSWRRNKRHSAPTDTSTIASSVETTPTSSNIPILPFSSHNPSTGTIDNITDHHMIGSTATTSSPMTPSSMISSITEIPSFAGITTIDPTNFTTTTATTLLTATALIFPLSSPQETPPEQQLPSLSKSSTTTTTPSTSTVSVTTTSSYHQITDYQYRQQQQWQQQHQQQNNNNNDYYYYRGRQQHYPPPPPGSTGMDNYYYIQQQQQQQWQQQHPQTQPHRLPQQHPIATNDYSNGYQPQTMDSGGYRTGDYYYRQQQQNYHNHQHNNDRQQQTPQPPRNSSLTLQFPNGGSWNVRGDRPLYISSGGGGDNNRDAPVAWNSSTSTSSNYNGGWTTAAQQHWWYQQQQQQQQQLQKQQRQQQNNRGLGGILSLPPVPLPPLHTEQGAVTISMPTPQPLHPRRQQKPQNHYYQPTLTTKTSSKSYQLRPKSESRYYQEREYQCIGQWTEPQEHFSPVAGEKPVMLTYTYLKRLSPVSKEGTQYECFVGTPIPNDEGVNPETTTTILLTEAGTNTMCSRLQDPYRSGMKLVGTKIKKEGACKGSAQPVQDTTGGSWYSLKPQSISPPIPGAENGGGAWYAAPPVPVIAAQGPTTMTPILTGRHTGGNGATFTSRHNEQNRRPQSANVPPKTNHSFRTVADKRIVILAVILFTARRFFN